MNTDKELFEKLKADYPELNNMELTEKFAAARREQLKAQREAAAAAKEAETK